ncbi:YdeI/OmpD-associated family protein [Novosphingobium album (ex Liu et al. 2023)]|uniref:YdeI/OmpD-associated family protein n=1 Tax=Novosphingobium album (ex Liu et al. 2023) TaxID=3031130 RepID=A0ABT5WTK3_9SPHN|nr:YdeI/OmpD-associated family protein [Novosphingobium album (ex Liu et al. 2023)]MDE8653223.1 YdeI/OmpD-associated family protein [Novosphingobium album (ex Liu et al. 2023)]
MAKDTRVDAYIAGAADFARPILEHLRDLAHRALPDADETIKWSRPHFTVKGKNIAGMAEFKAHCIFTIHGEGRQGEAMGQYGRITALADLPPDADLVTSLQAARARVLQQGSARKEPVVRAPKPEIPMPDDFAAALAAVPAAQAAYDGFPPSARREYLEWITEAKSEATRHKRVAQAIEWIAEGKKRHWKYQRG